MKKRLSIFLCATMMLGMLYGCGNTDAAQTVPDSQETATTEVLESAEGTLNLSESITASAASDLLAEVDDSVLAKKTTTSTDLVAGNKTLDNVDYVMIYNPYIYEETVEKQTSDLYTGDFKSQIAVGTNRAGELDLDVVPLTVAQPSSLDIEYQPGGRASGLVETYDVGDKSDFYYYSSLAKGQKIIGTFECIYNGKNCYIWTMKNSIDSASAKKYGEEFDKNIYDQDVKAFGEPRFTEDGGKVNILVYPFDADGVCGFFSIYDLFSASEVSPAEIKAYGLNTDRAIINLGSNMLSTLSYEQVCSTLSHEFQHLICASDTLEGVSQQIMSTWLNESMSAFAEEYIYPGVKIKGNYNLFFYVSESFAKGQSLYNFDVENDQYIGAYGAVYLFEEYLRKNSGNEVITNLHKFWRTSADANSVDKALYNAVSDKFQKSIDSSITYPAAITSRFGDASSEWMSKLTLNFYLETLGTDLGDLTKYNGDFRSAMIYDEVSPVNIEGGGRIIVATQNHSYQIPADASPDLVYIGLDKDFNVVTDIVTSDAANTSSTSTTTTNTADADFKWNSNMNSYIYSTSTVPATFTTAVDTGLTTCGMKASKVVTKASPEEILKEMKANNHSKANTGMITIVLSKEFKNMDDYSAFVDLCGSLVSQGIVVSYVGIDILIPQAYTNNYNVGIFNVEDGDLVTKLKNYSDSISYTLVVDMVEIALGKKKPYVAYSI